MSEFSLVNEDKLIAEVKKALDNNHRVIADYKSGNQKAINVLIGVIMNALERKADVTKIKELLLFEIEKR